MSKRVERFNKTERIAHWANAIFFGLLFLSGMVLFFGTIATAIGHGGVAFTKLVHRIAAVPFILIVPVMMIFGTPKTTKIWLKEIFTWSKDDIVWITGFAKEFFGGHVKLPTQGRLNAGEKINSLLGIVGCGLLVFSGLIMWFNTYFSSSFILTAYAIHDMAAAVVGAAIIGHSYLGLFHPGSKEALSGMLDGTVSAEFAKSHHEKWYNDVVNSQTKTSTPTSKNGISPSKSI
jgi:formate dehydrogenase subunit gamma